MMSTTNLGIPGYVITDFERDADYIGNAIEPTTGKIFALGTGFGDGFDGPQIILAKYTANGRLDAAFGDGGVVTTDLGDIGNDWFDVNHYQLLSDGKHLITGSYIEADDTTGQPVKQYSFVARLNADGTLDNTFGDPLDATKTGWTKAFDTNEINSESPYDYDSENAATAMALQGSNIITLTYIYNAEDNREDLGIMRFDKDGALDTTFGGGDALVSFSIPEQDFKGAKVFIQSDNKILIISEWAPIDVENVNATVKLMRFNADGSLDTTYGTNGIATPSFPSAPSGQDSGGDAILLADQSVLYAYGTSKYDVDTEQYTPGDFILTKITASGALDSTFGNNGMVETDFGYDEYPVSIKSLSDGSILVAGNFYDSNNYDGAFFAVAKYTAKGVLDKSFGTNGYFKSDFIAGGSLENEITVDSKGKILISGYVEYATNDYDSVFITMRLNKNGKIDKTFVGENNAPILNPDLTRSLEMFQGDSTTPIACSYFNDGFDSFSLTEGAVDLDGKSSSELGIAVVNVSGVTGGTVEYSIDSGKTWIIDKNVLASGEATVFAGNTLIRYTPPANATGERTMEFHTWDGTGGYKSGQKVNLDKIGTGGSTPFSIDTASHTLYINEATSGTESDDVLTAETSSDDSVGAYILGLDGEDILNGSELSDKLDGGTQDDAIYGNEGEDHLIGGNGDDALYGGLGEDKLFGGEGGDDLDGGEGADVMTGGDGQDVYFVDDSDDQVIETNTSTALEEADRVESEISYRLGANVERLTLIGADAIDGTGNKLNNILIGNDAANILDGGAGADSMNGADGDDVYKVDHIADTVTESNTEIETGGSDRVDASVTFTLGDNIEHLSLTGKAKINGTGNELDNTIIGNSAANTLNGAAGDDIIDGGGGSDTMIGGDGNDSYVVGSAGDKVIETNADEGSGGVDIVHSSISYTLGSNIESLTLTGTAKINGTGNTLDNILTGNSAANILNGGIGEDSMSGGDGSDVYVVDNIEDVVIETNTDSATGGIDRVETNISFTLGDNVENLTLTGTAAINGSGNMLNNTIIGNASNNLITGGAGKDTLTGGKGADTFNFNALSDSVIGINRDVIKDFKAKQGDKIDLSTMDANTVEDGDQAFSSTILTSGAFTQVGQLKFVGGILYGNTDSDFSTTEFEIQLTGVKAITASAFIL